jgi:hypothetical protein
MNNENTPGFSPKPVPPKFDDDGVSPSCDPETHIPDDDCDRPGGKGGGKPPGPPKGPKAQDGIVKFD